MNRFWASLSVLLLIVVVVSAWSLWNDPGRSDSTPGFLSDEMLIPSDAAALISVRGREQVHRRRNLESFQSATLAADEGAWEWEVLPYEGERLDWTPISDEAKAAIELYERRIALCKNEISLTIRNIGLARESGYEGDMADVRDAARGKVERWFQIWSSIVSDGPVTNPTLFEWEKNMK